MPLFNRLAGKVPVNLNKNSNRYGHKQKLSSSIWVGGLILAIGSVLLLDRMDLLYFPYWLFSWKTLLIAIGVIFGINRKFEGIGWLVMILIGTFFLIDDIPGFPYDVDRYAFPVGIIVVGAFIVGRALLVHRVKRASLFPVTA